MPLRNVRRHVTRMSRPRDFYPLDIASDSRDSPVLRRAAQNLTLARLTVRQVHSQAALTCLFVFFVHVAACIAHGGDAIVEWHEVLAITAQR